MDVNEEMLLAMERVAGAKIAVWIWKNPGSYSGIVAYTNLSGSPIIGMIALAQSARSTGATRLLSTGERERDEVRKPDNGNDHQSEARCCAEPHFGNAMTTSASLYGPS